MRRSIAVLCVAGCALLPAGGAVTSCVRPGSGTPVADSSDTHPGGSGTIGADVDVDTAYRAAGLAARNAVADGATAALTEVLGPGNRPARSAIGVASLPSGAPVEVQLIAAVG